MTFLVNGEPIAAATTGTSTTTLQIDDRTATVSVRASFGGRRRRVTLAPDADQFTFSFNHVPAELEAWEHTSNKKPSPPDDNLMMLKGISNIVMKEKQIIGSYRRWDEQTVNNLREWVQRISRGLCEKTRERNNFLIWAAPGSGKTFLIEEIARSHKDLVSFVIINFAKATRDDMVSLVDEIKSAVRPTLVLFDEIDARAEEAWLYENTFSLLDLNTQSEIKQAVFVLIGSMAGGMQRMVEAMMQRHKGSDLVTRVHPQFRFIIPHTTAEDQLIIIASQMEISGRERIKKITKVEKLAAYYILRDPRFKNPRHLGDLIKSAMTRVEEGNCRLYYANLFDRFDIEANRFWAENNQSAEHLHNTFIQIQ